MRYSAIVAMTFAGAATAATANAQEIQASPSAPIPPAAALTWTKHVAPIIEAKCQVCHQPNSVAPMSLMKYEDVQQYADQIRSYVADRVMPPWQLDRTVGIKEYKNDRGLSDEQIATILKWMDGGMQRGKAEDAPPPAPPPPPATGWQLSKQLGGEPDLVLKSPPLSIAARTQDKWFRPVTDIGLTEPRWVRAIEIRPATEVGRKVVHHVLTLLEQKEEGGLVGLAHSAHDAQTSAGLFMEWSIGKTGEIFAADAGKLLLPGSKIRWEVHMFAIGEAVKDQQVEMALYFYPKGFVPQHRTVLRMFDVSRGSDLDIPPGEKAMTQNFYVMPAPARIENFQPHMHMRGKAMTMEAVYPDGKKEVLSAVNNFQWKWHVNYVFADDAAPLLPKGTMLVFTAWHDNTANNPNNPDPKQWVGWGDRTVDEMAHAWVDVTYLEPAEFDQMVAARKAKKAAAKPQASVP